MGECQYHVLVCLRADCTMMVHASMRCQCRPTSLLSKLKFRSYEGPYYHARASNGPKRQSLRGTLGANLGKHWPTWGQLGVHLGLTWGQLGVPLGHTCGHLGPTWANMVQLGANVGQLGPTSVRMRDPTTMQEPATAQRGRAFVALLGPTWANIGQQGANLGHTWSNLGATWGPFGTNL